jgi:hypothetical protein
MAHAAAAAVLLRRPLLFLKEARLLSSLAAPLPGLRRHPRALRPAGRPLPSDAEDDTDDPDAGAGAESFKKSRNELKREARRAVKWGMDLASFSPPQIKRILSAASLEREVFDALMLVKVRTSVRPFRFLDEIVVDHRIGDIQFTCNCCFSEIWAGCAGRKEETVQLHRSVCFSDRSCTTSIFLCRITVFFKGLLVSVMKFVD